MINKAQLYMIAILNNTIHKMEKRNRDPENWLVAHRGDQTDHTENTFNAFKAAAQSGALFAECDIQFTRDLEPVVIHDDSLMRLSELALHVSLLDLIDLKELCYPYFTLLTLRKLLAWLERNPQLTLFIEVKPDIRKRLNDHDIAERLASVLVEPLLSRIVVISESGGILDACRARLNCHTGWVAEGEEQPQTAMDYIFMHHAKAATISEWQSRGVKVGLYTINDAATASALREAGADLIETDHFSRMASELSD